MTSKWNSASAAPYSAHRIIWFFIRYGGRAVAYFLLYYIVAFYTLVPAFRRRTYPYIARRFPGCGFWGRLRHCYRMYLIFGRTLVDRAALGIKGDISIISSEEDKEMLRALHSRGKGLMVITAHCGNWRSAMSSFDFLEGEKTILFHRAAGDVDRLAHEHGNIKQKAKYIDPAGYMGGVIELLATLHNNGIICAMGDREFGSSKGTVEVMFLGKTIRVPVSMYRAAASAGTPVVIAYFPY
jgi:predicted LPLAT superfamily acyltransferase